MITFKTVKGQSRQKVVVYQNKSAIISWNSIKGATEEGFERNIREIIKCLTIMTPLVSVMDYLKPYNLVLILSTFFSEDTKAYLRHFIVKQFCEFKTTTIDMVLTEIFGRSMIQCFVYREPLVQELVKTIEIILDEEYENHFACGDYIKFDSKFNGRYNGYYTFKFKGNMHSISWCYFDSQDISQLKAIKLLAEIIVSLKEKLDNNIPLHNDSRQLGPTNLIELMFSLYPKESTRYFKHFAAEFTDRRERITTNRLLRITIDPKIKNSHRFISKKINNFGAEIEAVTIEEYSRQCIIFPQTNLEEMTMDREAWRYYYIQGSTLNCKTYNFSDITSETIRQEYMLYLRNDIRNSCTPPNASKYSNIIIGITSLLEINPSIKRFCDIRKTDVRLLKTYLQTSVRTKHNNASLSVSTMSRIFSYLSDTVAFLTEYYLLLAKKDLHYQEFVPKYNYFCDFRLANVNKMTNNTISIPDVVMQEVNKYKDEISESYSLMFDIFNWTGLRAKEVELLEEGCVRYDKENEFWYLVAGSLKTLKSLRKNGLPSKRIVAVPHSIAKRIRAQEEQTKLLREMYKTPYIFIKKSKGYGHEYGIIRASNMIKALNLIVKRYNITDESNKPWNFTTRQSRKTFAVKLISNGASIEELATALGHLWLETTAIYYAEIERMKVADMNTEFFRHKFEILLGEKQLARFNDQEKKQLYFDFCLDFRQVELGFCSRHISQGVCDKIECATCNCLCTGPDYLEQWITMRDQQQQLLDNLLNLYFEKGYENYEEFPEFNRTLHLRNSYQDVINKITVKMRNDNGQNI